MNLYVSNLGDQITDESLRAVFATYGEVSSSVVVRDKVMSTSIGFAYIDMPDTTQAMKAIGRLHGSVLNGRELSVQPARPGFGHPAAASETVIF